MYLKDLLKTLRRRWYLAALGLFLTWVLGLLTILFTSPTYTAVTSMFLIPPKNAIGLRGNPYLNLSGLGPARDVLAARVSSSPTARQIAKEDPSAEIAVDPGDLTAAPVLVISVSARSSDAAMQFRDRLATEVAPTLAAMQGDLLVPMSSRIVVSTLASDPKPEKEIKNQLRSVIFVVGIGCAITIVGTSLLDSLLARRRSRFRTAANSTKTEEGDIVEAADPNRETRESQILGEELPDVERLGNRDGPNGQNDNRRDPRADQRAQPGSSVTPNGLRGGQ